MNPNWQILFMLSEAAAHPEKREPWLQWVAELMVENYLAVLAEKAVRA